MSAPTPAPLKQSQSHLPPTTGRTRSGNHTVQRLIFCASLLGLVSSVYADNKAVALNGYDRGKVEADERKAEVEEQKNVAAGELTELKRQQAQPINATQAHQPYEPEMVRVAGGS